MHQGSLVAHQANPKQYVPEQNFSGSSTKTVTGDFRSSGQICSFKILISYRLTALDKADDWVAKVHSVNCLKKNILNGVATNYHILVCLTIKVNGTLYLHHHELDEKVERFILKTNTALEGRKPLTAVHQLGENRLRGKWESELRSRPFHFVYWNLIYHWIIHRLRIGKERETISDNFIPLTLLLVNWFISFLCLDVEFSSYHLSRSRWSLPHDCAA